MSGDAGQPSGLWLVDSSLYVFRAWQVAPLAHDEAGRPCNATRGFSAWLNDLLFSACQQPGPAPWVVCTFDSHDGQGLRRELSVDYKSERPPVPAALFEQIERCRQLARAIGIPVFTGGALEADDLIGHFAGLARSQARPVMIVSGDKDLAQYLGEHDRWWDAGRRDPLDARAVAKRFRVRPEQIPDWLALAGDESDGIRGVPGVGAPTAARLLKRFATLDMLFERVAEVATMGFRGAPRVAVLLREHEAAVRLARRLTGPLVDDSLPGSLTTLEPQSHLPQDMTADLVALGIAPGEAPHLAAIAARWHAAIATRTRQASPCIDPIVDGGRVGAASEGNDAA